MPGDGGTGIIVGTGGYKTLRRTGMLRGTSLFASGQYLINPRVTNGTPSIMASLGVPTDASFASSLVNSVTDSYSWQAGASFKVPLTWQHENLRGLRFRLITGMEGIPAHDLIGGSRGYRQPRYTITLGPGLSWGRKKEDHPCSAQPTILGCKQENSACCQHAMNTFGGRC